VAEAEGRALAAVTGLPESFSLVGFTEVEQRLMITAVRAMVESMRAWRLSEEEVLPARIAYTKLMLATYHVTPKIAQALDLIELPKPVPVAPVESLRLSLEQRQDALAAEYLDLCEQPYKRGDFKRLAHKHRVTDAAATHVLQQRGLYRNRRDKGRA
jgi:hypothetical protein